MNSNEGIITNVLKEQSTILKDAMYKMNMSSDKLRGKIDVFTLSAEQLEYIKLINENMIKIEEIMRSYNIISDINVNERNINDDLTGTKVKQLIIEEYKQIPVKTHKEVLIKFCKFIYEQDRDKFFKITSSMSNLINSNPDNLISPKEFAIGLYVGTQLSAKNIYRTIAKLSVEYGINPEDIKIIIE